VECWAQPQQSRYQLSLSQPTRERLRLHNCKRSSLSAPGQADFQRQRRTKKVPCHGQGISLPRNRAGYLRAKRARQVRGGRKTFKRRRVTVNAHICSQFPRARRLVVALALAISSIVSVQCQAWTRPTLALAPASWTTDSAAQGATA